MTKWLLLGVLAVAAVFLKGKKSRSSASSDEPQLRISTMSSGQGHETTLAQVASDELGVAWDDPAVAADWGVTDPTLSERDQENPMRAALPENRRPYWPMRT